MPWWGTLLIAIGSIVIAIGIIIGLWSWLYNRFDKFN